MLQPVLSRFSKPLPYAQAYKQGPTQGQGHGQTRPSFGRTATPQEHERLTKTLEEGLNFKGKLNHAVWVENGQLFHPNSEEALKDNDALKRNENKAVVAYLAQKNAFQKAGNALAELNPLVYANAVWVNNPTVLLPLGADAPAERYLGNSRYIQSINVLRVQSEPNGPIQEIVLRQILDQDVIDAQHSKP
ncbi:MAG: hypothetical protein VKJ06_04870 [Vampirovibrionales bacterium]|nr:hypothetical protein [Vampirovibrionales bacterium]